MQRHGLITSIQNCLTALLVPKTPSELQKFQGCLETLASKIYSDFLLTLYMELIKQKDLPLFSLIL